MIRRSFPRTGTLLPIALALGGCAALGVDDESRSMPDPEIVATDLVYTLAQLDELNPYRTTLQHSPMSTAFGRRVIDRLDDAGYGLQEVSGDRGERYVRYRATRSESEVGATVSYAVAVGPVSAERDYAVLDGETVPVSPLVLRGVSAQDVHVDEALFADRELAPTLAKVSFDVERTPALLALGADAALPDDVRTFPVPIVAAAMPDTPEESMFRTAVKQNMFDSQRSNYASLFREYEDVRHDELIFDNDSLRLGRINKAIIESYVAELDPKTDVLSVIGCSHGASALPNGNEVLAIGRANRVKEAFLYAGIDHRQVLEESCWANRAHARFPKRGVVLTLKRLREAVAG